MGSASVQTGTGRSARTQASSRRGRVGFGAQDVVLDEARMGALAVELRLGRTPGCCAGCTPERGARCEPGQERNLSPSSDAGQKGGTEASMAKVFGSDAGVDSADDV